LSAASTSVIESTSKIAGVCLLPVIPCFMFYPASPAYAATSSQFICGRTRVVGSLGFLSLGCQAER
jgi:hypothetical protein